MRRRAIVFFAVFATALVASASPASAASLAIASEHTDGFQNATLSGMTVSGSGGSVGLFGGSLIDDFEDGDLSPDSSAWSDWSSDMSVTSTDPLRGDYSGEVAAGGTASATRSSATTNDVRASIRARSATDESIEFYVTDSTMYFDPDGTVRCQNGNTYSDCGTWEPGSAIDVHISYDLAADSATYRWGNQSWTGEYTGDGYGYIHFRAPSDSPLVVDGIWESTTPDSGTYVGAEHTADDVSEVRANLLLSNSSATVYAQAWDGSEWTNASSTTTSTSGTVAVSLPSPADRVRTRVDFEATGANHSASLRSESAWFEPRAPSGSGFEPPDGAELDSPATNFSANVSDPDFGTEQGDTVNAALYVNGDEEHNETLASNGTADTTVSGLLGGENSYYWEFADSYGATTTTGTRTIYTPAELTVRNASDPSQLVDNVTLTVRFYSNGDVVERESSDGTVSLAGLPTGESFVVSVQPGQGYAARRMVVDSIYDQQSVFLLPDSADAADVLFELDDPTGVYSSQARLYVERPITLDGETRYRTVSADEFGPGGVSTWLQVGARYQLRIENQAGMSVVLGSYTPTVDDAVTLRPSTSAVSRDSVDQGAIYYNASVDRDAESVFIHYDDPNAETSELTISVVNKWNDSDYLRHPQTFYDVGSLVLEEPINGSLNTSYIVYFNGTRNGSAFRGQVQIGPGGVSFVPENIGEPWGTISGVFIMLLSAGLFSRANAGTGTVVVSLEGGVLWYIGLLDGVVTVGVVVVAVGVALLFNMSDRT